MAITGGATPPPRTMKSLTMFYNGGVGVFHLPQDKAEDLIKIAVGQGDGDGGRRPDALAMNRGDELLAQLREEMPIASRRSLQRFFLKREERS